MSEIMNENVKIMDATSNDYKITQPIKQEDSKFYTIYSYKLARTLLHKGCTIADIGLNTKMKGIVFHFVNEPKLHEIIKLQHEINEAHRKMNGFNKPTAESNKEITSKIVNKDRLVPSGDGVQIKAETVIGNVAEPINMGEPTNVEPTNVEPTNVEPANVETTNVAEVNDTNEFVQATAS